MKPNNEIEIRSLIGDLHIESREEGTVSRTIVGYAAKFESWSAPIMGWFREKIARGAFDGCDLSDVIMCFNHNTDSILARTTSGTLRLEVDDVGLTSRNVHSASALRRTIGSMPTKRTASRWTSGRYSGFRVWWMCRSWSFLPILKPKLRCGISKSGKPSICANTHRSRNEMIVLPPKAGREKRFVRC